MRAFECQDKDEVLLLLPHTVLPHLIRDVEWCHYTLLHHAAECGWADVCHTLVEHYQCIPDATAAFGYSVLHIACRRGQESVVKYLLTLKSVIDTVTARDCYGDTSMEYVFGIKYKVLSQFIPHIELETELRVRACFKVFMAGNE